MNDEERELFIQEAVAYAKANRRRIARELTNKEVYRPDANPVSVFMAGSPGAGKTEASKELIDTLVHGTDTRVLRIDADDLRAQFPSYDGNNAALFQGAAAILLEKIHDMALEQSQSFLLDGTLSNYERAERNINRSLGRGRTVQILYVYQEPGLAWQFVQARQAAEGRHVPAEEFVNQYFGARETVNKLKIAFKDRIKVDLLLKNTVGRTDSTERALTKLTTTYPRTTIETESGSLWA